MYSWLLRQIWLILINLMGCITRCQIWWLVILFSGVCCVTCIICEKLDFQPADSLADGKNLNDTLAFQVSEENMNHIVGMPCHFAHFQPMCKLSHLISITVFMRSACKKMTNLVILYGKGGCC